jgi:uncharacterized protein (DUF2126 family)
VKVSGFATESRYVIACNGRKVPLTSAGDPKEAVAGVRYRARRLSATLHPTIPVHTPLVFDIIDRWKERSIGRCTYHTGPPDGRPYTARPTNAREAEERRRERFQGSGHTLGPMAAPEQESDPIFPLTLDLRRLAPGQKTQTEKRGLVP